MRFYSLFTIILVLLAAVSICPAMDGAVKLGALYNMTGAMSPIDEPAAKGAKLAVKLFNNKGKTLKGKKLELELIDTKTDPEAQKKAADKLVSIPVSAGLGYGDSNPVLICAPVFQDNKIPFLTSGATDPQLPEKIGEYMFMAPFGDNAQAYAIADFAHKRLKARNVVLWTNESTTFTKALAKYFEERFLSLDGTRIQEKKFKGDQEDFSPMIRELEESDFPVDAIFISGNPHNAKLTVGQLRKAGIELPILSGDGFDADLLTLLPDPAAAEGVYFTTHVYLKSSRPEVRSFVEAYKKEYGKAPESSFAALGFDAVNLLINAIERAKSPQGPDTAKALGQTSHFKGVTGDISFSEKSRVPAKTVTIMTVKDGHYEQAESWTPDQ
jgi:branched-chain amino acid transport system substrate-binding protein